MSEINIDAVLVRDGGAALSRTQEKLVEFTNGCICCTLRDDLLAEVRRLAAEQRFDYLLIESTGISEPMPVAATFAAGYRIARGGLADQLIEPLLLDKRCPRERVVQWARIRDATRVHPPDDAAGIGEKIPFATPLSACRMKQPGRCWHRNGSEILIRDQCRGRCRMFLYVVILTQRQGRETL